MTTQVVNTQLNELLKPFFVGSERYAQDAYARALQFALTRPGLVAAWAGVVDIGTPALVDVSGNGQHLAFNGDAHVAQDENLPFVPYIALDGSGDYLSRPDDAKLDILGTETRIASGLRGLTFAAWVRFTNTASAIEVIGSKWNATGNLRSWIVYRDASGFFNGSVSSAGSAVSATAVGTSALAAGVWHHVAMVYAPSAALTIYVNGAQDGIDNTSIPASLFNSTSPLVFGANGALAQLMTGQMSPSLLCASALPADLIFYYYNMTRHLFGV